MYGMVYQQTLILAHLEVLPAQLNSRIYLYLYYDTLKYR